MEHSTPQHAIGYVAKRTGLSTHVLRIWERRYGAVKPHKTDTQRRLYSDADIDRLRLLRALTQSGHSIGRVANIRDEEMKKLLREDSEPFTQYEYDPASTVAARSNDSVTGQHLQACRQAIGSMDPEALDKCLAMASVNLSAIQLLEDVIVPLMVWVGKSWHDGSLRISNEHMASAIVSAFLTRLRNSFSSAEGAPTIVVATPSTEHHDLGAQLAATAAALEGWKVLYLGPDLPASEIASAAMNAQARAVAISISPPADNPLVIREIEDLHQFLPKSVRIVVGGGGAERHRAFLQELDCACNTSLTSFQDTLQEIRL